MSNELKNYYIANDIYNSIIEIENCEIDAQSLSQLSGLHQTRSEAIKYLSGLRDQKIIDYKKLVMQLEYEIYVLENLNWENIEYETR